jgi:nicotinate-nucleotide adenylyltransferase
LARGAARRIGVLGGTFDPPHVGHLALAETARVQLELDVVLFAPAGWPPHKPDWPITARSDRVAMVEAAIADNKAFALSRIDLDRPGPHYTADTLSLLRQQDPEAEFLLLVGGDSLEQFLSWHDPAGILSHARVAVLCRPGYKPDLATLEAEIPEISERVFWLDGPYLALASSDLRRRVRTGLTVRYLVPPLVEAYIREHRLYIGRSF